MPVPVTFEVKRMHGRTQPGSEHLAVYGLTMECPQLVNGRAASSLTPVTYEDLETLHAVLEKILSRKTDSVRATAAPGGSSTFREVEV